MVCKCMFHAKCVGLGEGEIGGSYKDWRCQGCADGGRTAMQSVGESQEVTLSLLMKKLMDMEVKMSETANKLETDLGQSIEFCHGDVANILRRIEVQDGRLDAYFKKFEEQEREIAALKAQNIMLQERVGELEQYSRVNCFEIHGIPQQENENVSGIVVSVGRALNYPVTEFQIDNCHRLPARQGGGRPPAIIVKMVRRSDKEAFLQKRRVKRDLCLRHLGQASDAPIYLNESLSLERRKLLAAARKTSKEKNYKFVWVRNGKIFARRDEKSAVIHIDSMSDVERMT
jgi:hypothetical protein